MIVGKNMNEKEEIILDKIIDEEASIDPTIDKVKLKDEIIKHLKMPKSLIKKDPEFYNILTMLEIPHVYGHIDGRLLVDILMDPEKLQVLVSKLNNKAFW